MPGTVAADVVVVLSYRGARDTMACVESLIEGSPLATVLVIDNGSYDGVLEQVRERWPGTHTLQTGTNLGFAGGMNVGLRWAMARGATTITVLNNDTVVPSGAIARLSAIAADGYLVSPEVRYLDDPDTVWFGGGVIDEATGLARHLGHDEIASRPGDESDGLRFTEVLSGCCLTASGATWRRLGGFDESFFLNFEDSELSLRARGLGIPLVVATSVRIHHRVSASFSGEYSYLGLFYYARNGLRFGSLLPGRTVIRRWRFLRHRIAPVLTAEVRQRRWRTATRKGLVAATALVMHLRRRDGRAPAVLERLARRWAGTSS